MNHEIAVRFYENRKYGRTYAKGAFHKAVFNATADLIEPQAKYLLDLFSMSDWQQIARTELEQSALAMAQQLVNESANTDLLASYIKRLDPAGVKQPIAGFALLDTHAGLLHLLINDPALGVQEAWSLTVKHCKVPSGSQNSPQLLATNAQLN